ncbi:hypothetical protein NDU88_000854 [Pleurodeles waltl]|uniref:Uncharacterized protein n=1 Tax=Pleurodeles waltl TaxID=8319 RepID=A0AAV7Q588_PLEWA|nr:hypothetical protein NDU88_000854 [Pleurodeles waltl]
MSRACQRAVKTEGGDPVGALVHARARTVQHMCTMVRPDRDTSLHMYTKYMHAKALVALSQVQWDCYSAMESGCYNLLFM